MSPFRSKNAEWAYLSHNEVPVLYPDYRNHRISVLWQLPPTFWQDGEVHRPPSVDEVTT